MRTEPETIRLLFICFINYQKRIIYSIIAMYAEQEIRSGRNERIYQNTGQQQQKCFDSVYQRTGTRKNKDQTDAVFQSGAVCGTASLHAERHQQRDEKG